LHVHTTLPPELAFSKSTTWFHKEFFSCCSSSSIAARSSFCATSYYQIAKERRRGSTSSLKSELGWLIGLTTTLGRIPPGPNVPDMRIQANTYLFFQDTTGNVSGVYSYPKRIGYGYATPRSIRVTEYDTVGFFIHAPLNDLWKDDFSPMGPPHFDLILTLY